MNSLLGDSGVNKFQEIKAWMKAAEAAGKNLIKLSIGQPSGPALEPLRLAASQACLSNRETTWEYQDNGSPDIPDFAQRFVACHVLADQTGLVAGASYLPVPGIKPMLGVVMEAMGAWRRARPSRVLTMTNPGYPTPADQALMKKNIVHHDLPLDPTKGFLFSLVELDKLGLGEGDLIMLNFPHNPTGIISSKEWLMELCAFAQERGIRLFNDAAYAILSHDPFATDLTDVAKSYCNLSWAGAFSASKAGNNTGVRIGAMVGSPDFIGDIAKIKGNTDSGFVSPMAHGVLHLYEKHRHLIRAVSVMYQHRLGTLNRILTRCGMRLAVEPKAGFFALYECPKQAFGQAISSAKEFNRLMVEKTGVVGVQFDPYIRYAVCTEDIGALANQIGDAFTAANVQY